jgi:hypothetical protein
MRFLFKTSLKIAVLFIVFSVPVGIFVSLFILNARNIPVWNIGIRNLLIGARNVALPIVVISFLFSTLFTISTIDKMKIRSIFLLHIPALIVGALLLWAFYGAHIKSDPLSLREQEVRLGLLSFFKEAVFNEIENRAVYVKRQDDSLYTFYVFDKSNNSLTILKNVSTGEKGKNRMIIHQKEKKIEFFSGKRTSLELPFSAFKHKGNSINNAFVQFYMNQLRKTFALARSSARGLKGPDLLLFLGVLFLSVLMISIPLTYGLNDGGWGFSGVSGVILIILVFPFFYGAILRFFRSPPFAVSFLGRFSYLFPALVLCAIGILLDIIIKVRGMKKGI